jgi:glucosamine kinase
VLICGTGAVAAEIDGDRLVRTSDGLGWLLGDLGSAFWIGRAAATATATALYEGAAPTPLTRAMSTEMGAGGASGDPNLDGDRFVAAVYRRPPRDLAALAPLVTAVADAGDPVAAAILDEAAAHLFTTMSRVLGPGPLVLAGGVLRNSPPVREGLMRRLRQLCPGLRTSTARPSEVGAARLAAATLNFRARTNVKPGG